MVDYKIIYDGVMRELIGYDGYDRGPGYDGSDYIGDRYYETEEEIFTPHDGYYVTGNGDSVYQCQGEEEDLTA